MDAKLIARYILGDILSISGMGVALFWSAGRIGWWPAWAAIAVMSAWMTAVGIIVTRFHPNLLTERLAPPKGAKTWDKVILSIIRFTQLARYIIAGLDYRYRWTVGFPLAAQIGALTLCVFGYAVFAWAIASNRFFSQVVRIRSDRGHAIATSGPYRYVRHPSYAGAILSELALSTLLASWWALIAGGLCAILLIIRTILEDRTLQAELTGYMNYSRQVRYRMLPGIW